MDNNFLYRTTRRCPPSIRSKSLYAILKRAHVEGAYITGSVALGCAELDSDLDIAVPINCRKRIVTTLKQGGYSIEESLYNNGFKVSGDGYLYAINVIPLHPLDWNAWLWATQTLALKDLTAYDRNGRHRLFEFAVLAYKTLIAQPRDYDICSCGVANFPTTHVIVTED